jgi:hypothetical protein
MEKSTIMAATDYYNEQVNTKRNEDLWLYDSQ